ncbi:hypothetical protein PG987_003123 [Apiospora arundinis]|uniref:Uncharacterized protein n=1 Tax=Apiospora arundinis TaxID=335852 RepID=A0ABR2HZP5_9PEZI
MLYQSHIILTRKHARVVSLQDSWFLKECQMGKRLSLGDVQARESLAAASTTYPVGLATRN